MTLVVLVRHGQASWGEPDYDVLSARGHAQARTLGGSWHRIGFAPTRLISGSMRRHRETATGIAGGLGDAPAIETVPGLEEFDHLDVFADSIAEDGRLPRLDQATMAKLLGEGFARWIAGDGVRTYNETYAAFRERVRTTVEAIHSELGAGDKAVVVTSGGVIASVVCDLLGVEARRWPDLVAPIVNSSTHRVLIRDGRPILVSYNEHGHLATDEITYT